MKIIEGFELAKKALSRTGTARDMAGFDERESVVRQIIEDVRQRGDAALFDYTLKLDGARLTALEVRRTQVKRAYRQIDAELLSALKVATERIGDFHTKQREAIREKLTLPGLSQLIRPLERVGIYVPGGTASYPSTVLMTAIPARVAGVKEIVLVTPPKKNGAIPSPTLVAADIAGVDRIFAVGGAQAVAALAFGTESIPRVDKICGPGNIYVMLAKKLVYGVVGIDGIQGPSEVLIIADDTANPSYCASDLLAQAEHDPLASAILVTTSRRFAVRVQQELERQMEDLPRNAIVAESLSGRGIIAIVDNMDEAIELANLYAPEHLLLLADMRESHLERLTNAGCIIAGEKATVAFSDYIAGPSHVLPTGGSARFGSPLSVFDFLKLTNIVNVDDAELEKLGKTVQILARAEGLAAHARAVQKRLRGQN